MAPKVQDVDERFWSKVNKNGPQTQYVDTPCWYWTDALDKDGYGEFKVAGKKYRAHRWSLEHYSDDKPDLAGKMACHKCNRPACIRPDHLYPGDNSSNTIDSYRAGSRIAPYILHPESIPRRAKHPMAKLTESKVAAIRKAVARHGNIKKAWRDLAVDTISYAHCVKIANGTAW